MADWHLVTLQWVDCAPGPAQCECLNEDLYRLDYDCPKVTPTGLSAVRWRSPLLSLAELLDFCDLRGYPCRGKLTRYDHYGPEGEDLGCYEMYDHEQVEWTSSTFTFHDKFSQIIEPRRLRPTRFERI